MSAQKRFRDVVAVGVAAMMFALTAGCHSAPPSHQTVASAAPPSAKADGLPSLRHAMELLGDSVKKPASGFHLSFKRNGSNSSSYRYEADISPSGITGQSIEGTFTRNWNGTPMGSSDWRGVAMAVLSPLPYDELEWAQPGIKYGADESTGGFDTRRYDFDLASVPADAKSGTLLGSNAVGSMVGGEKKLKDYNVKGSAWIAKNDGRMVKTVYDYITVFSNGDQDATHYEIVATSK